jgi:hypothetical protein
LFELVGQHLDVHPALLKIRFVRLDGPRIFQREDGAEVARLAEGVDDPRVALAGLCDFIFL